MLRTSSKIIRLSFHLVWVNANVVERAANVQNRKSPDSVTICDPMVSRVLIAIGNKCQSESTTYREDGPVVPIVGTFENLNGFSKLLRK